MWPPSPVTRLLSNPSRLLTPNHSILGKLPETDIYVDVNAFANCEEIDRVKIFRFNSALCYLNRAQLRSKIEKLLPTIYKPQGFSAICSHFHQRNSIGEPTSGAINFLIIDCSALSYCDYSGATTLVELIEDLEREKVAVYLAACPLKLIDMLEKMNTNSRVLDEHVYPTISVAIGRVRYLLASRQSSSEIKLIPSVSSLAKKPQRAVSSNDGADKSGSTILDVPQNKL